MCQQGTCRPLRHPVWLDFGTKRAHRVPGTAARVPGTAAPQYRYTMRCTDRVVVFFDGRPHLPWPVQGPIGAGLEWPACCSRGHAPIAQPHIGTFIGRADFFIRQPVINLIFIGGFSARHFPQSQPPPPVQPGTPSQQFLAAGLSKRRPSLSSSA
jgi:hypothetical protein